MTNVLSTPIRSGHGLSRTAWRRLSERPEGEHSYRVPSEGGKADAASVSESTHRATATAGRTWTNFLTGLGETAAEYSLSACTPVTEIHRASTARMSPSGSVCEITSNASFTSMFQDADRTSTGWSGHTSHSAGRFASASYAAHSSA